MPLIAVDTRGYDTAVMVSLAFYKAVAVIIGGAGVAIFLTLVVAVHPDASAVDAGLLLARLCLSCACLVGWFVLQYIYIYCFHYIDNIFF